MAKTLYYVPMIHSPAELGSLGDAVKKPMLSILGKKVYKFFWPTLRIIGIPCGSE
jgi:hypothetical protein